MVIQMIKKLYHGTNMYFEEPDLAEAADFKDFGRGYYLTTNQFQAEKWAIRDLIDNDKNDVAYVYEYEFDTDDTKNLRILELLIYNEEWLDFIACNRTKKEENIQYDLIYDRMADSRGEILTEAIRDYINKIKTAKETLAIARFRDRNMNQYCFKTYEALAKIEKKRYAEVYRLNGKPKVIKWYKMEVENNG